MPTEKKAKTQEREHKMQGQLNSFHPFAESDTRPLPAEVSFRAAGDRADTPPGPKVGYYAMIQTTTKRRQRTRTRCFGPFENHRLAQFLKTSALALGIIENLAQAQLTMADGTPQ